jgi:hypothetical protein
MNGISIDYDDLSMIVLNIPTELNDVTSKSFYLEKHHLYIK